MRSFYFLLLLLTAASLQACAQTTAQAPAHMPAGTGNGSQPAAAVDATPPPMKPAPKLSDAEMEVFLKTAPIVSRKALDSGTTGSIRAILSDGKVTHDVHIQCLDVYRPVWKGAEGTVEKNFRDSWKFNIAAYRLARLLGIDDMVPMSVERTLEGKQCSVTWWVDNVWLVEVERRDKGIKPPATDSWVNQLNTIRVFDQLIYNTDRNQGNLLITPEWRVWMIDHTRAFRTQNTLLRPETLKRIDYGLLERLKKLNTVDLKRELGPWLRAEEIASILARRDEIVRFFEKEVRVKGEEAVLTGLARKTPHVTLP
jgi:hypothetical protein